MYLSVQTKNKSQKKYSKEIYQKNHRATQKQYTNMTVMNL